MSPARRSVRVAARATALSVALGVAHVGAVGAAPSTPAPPTTTPVTTQATVQASAPVTATAGLPAAALVIRGRGNGHGRGMSQFGALGWATKKGLAWQDILAFYYGGDGRVVAPLTEADAAAAPGGNVTVRLRAVDDVQTTVVSDAGTAAWAGAAGSFGAVLVRKVAKNVFDVWTSPTAKCPALTGDPSGFTLVGNDVAGPIEITTPNGATPTAAAPGELLGVCEPPSAIAKNGRVRYYRGAIRALTDANGAARTVNIVALESYVRGVVPRESPAGWGDQAAGAGMNALRAQAVAARSYALSESRYSYAKTCDNQDCQVYGGAGYRNVGSKTLETPEDKRSDTAVADTAGVVVKDAAGRIVRTEYTSSNGGRTAGGAFPAKADEGDLLGDAPQQAWTRLFSAAEVQKRYPSIGVFVSATVTPDGLGGDWNGYAVNVTITGTAGQVVRTGPRFRSDFGLPNHWIETSVVAGADPVAPAVGQILLVGDSVSESITTEFAAAVTPAYPAVDFQACAGRGMAGADCIATVAPPQLDLDGVGVVNASAAPAVAVVALGYNDDPATFDAELAQMLSSLASKGVQRTVFVNLSTRSTTRDYARVNQALALAAVANPSITVLDWNAASADPVRWRWFENSSLCCWVHLSQSGQAELALFLRVQLDALRAQGLLPTAATTAPVLLGLPLERGNAGVMVATVQKRINATLGLTGKSRISTDGTFGRATERRVREVQTKAQLPVTGVVDRATWDALGLAGRTDLTILRVGSRHPSVAAVQNALAKVLRRKIAATGVFDRTLEGHVKTLQKNLGVKVTGRVGPSTWTSLVAAAARA